jgi:hypothetical protein
MAGRDAILRVSERLYRALLVAYPREFRDAYGPQMAQVFRDSCRETVVQADIGGLVLLWARTLWDLLSTAIAERSDREAGGTLVIPFVSSPRMVWLGGVSFVLAGVLGLASIVLMDLSLAYPDEPIGNALSDYDQGASRYSPFIVLLHPVLSELLGTLAGLFGAIGLVGLYALVAGRAGRIGLWGGLLACLWVPLIFVFAGSNAYRLSVALAGDLGTIATDPLSFLVGLGAPMALVGGLLLAVATLRTGALGWWSVLPLVLMFSGLLLRLLLISWGFPVQHHPQALNEGIGTLFVVELPSVLPDLGSVLLGYLLLSAVHRNDEEPALASQA